MFVEIALGLDQPESELRLDAFGDRDVVDRRRKIGANVVLAGIMNDGVEPLELRVREIELAFRRVQFVLEMLGSEAEQRSGRGIRHGVAGGQRLRRVASRQEDRHDRGHTDGCCHMPHAGAVTVVLPTSFVRAVQHMMVPRSR